MTLHGIKYGDVYDTSMILVRSFSCNVFSDHAFQHLSSHSVKASAVRLISKIADLAALCDGTVVWNAAQFQFKFKLNIFDTFASDSISKFLVGLSFP